MFDVNKNDLTLLTMEYNDGNMKKILMKAVKDNIKLYAQHPEKNYFLVISSGSIDKIRKNHPLSASIVLGNFCYANSLESLTDTTDISFNDLWINKKEADALLTKLEEISGAKIASEKINRYSTSLIVLMYKTIEKFWLNHDPNNPPPKSEIIKKWLEWQGAARRVAEAIDTIIRPEIYKKGGNKSRAKDDILGQKK